MKHLRNMILFSGLGFIIVLLPVHLSYGDDLSPVQGIENRLSTELTLSDLLNYAYLKNPKIAMEKASWKGAIENLRIGESYPDPQVMATYFPAPIETRLGPQDWNLTVSQAIPFPGLLSHKGKVLEADARISKLELDKTIKSITVSIAASYHELGYIQKAIRIARANLELAQELADIGENAYADDQALFYDVSKARAQIAQIHYDILLLEELQATEKAVINEWLGRKPDASLGAVKALPPRQVIYTIDEIYAFTEANQEDIQIAETKIDQSDDMIRLSRYETLPSFKVGLFYSAIGIPDTTSPPQDAGDDAFGVQFGFSVPLWFGKNKSVIARAQAQKQKAEAAREAVANNSKTQISRLWFRLQNSKRLIELYSNELLPGAQRSVQTAQTWFEQGNGNFSDFLEIQATAYNFQLSLARAIADYGKTLVQLEQLSGVMLDRRQKTGEASS